MKMAGSVALVTGAASGIGLAIARTFASQGADLVLADLDSAGLAKAVETLPEARSVVADLRATEALHSLVDAALESFGRLDVLVNCAGLFRSCARDEVTSAEWREIFAVNLEAPFFLTRAAARPMIRQGSGSIINVSSVAGYYPRADQAAYCASKAGLEHLTRVFALELAPHGVRANGLRPGVVATSMAARELTAERLEGLRRSVPLGKMASAEQIAEAALFLATHGHMTGHMLCVDGGQTVNFA